MMDTMFKMYGEDDRRPDTYVANCLVARKLAEKDVRFIKFYIKVRISIAICQIRYVNKQ